ncbi:MAG TPA: aminoacyl-tRNA hydrolase [Stellaceae bacterium]|nr:aminoacyl-tRNA hydrolase [Stellaceae bacterium]
MRLIVGLGNPGARYERTRHNVGFVAADAIHRRHGFGPWRAKFQGLLAEGTLGGERLYLLKPQTFMNASGESVAEAARFYKIPIGEIAVIHDEIDLDPGKLRVKQGGGAAGHNGLRSIDAQLGDDYWRVRIGVGHPGVKELVEPYVLQNFSAEDQVWLPPLVDAIADAFPVLIADGATAFTTKVALILKPNRKEPFAGK